MLRCLVALTAILLLPGCSPRLAGPLHRDAAPAIDVARTAAARHALLGALRSGDSAAARGWLATDVQLTLPGGMVLRGRDAVLPELARAARTAGTFELARTRACTDALYDSGMLLDDVPVDGGERGMHAGLLWRAGARGTLELDAATLYPPADFSGYRRPCRSIPDSLFGTHRVTLLLEPGAISPASTRHGTYVDDGLRAQGWAEWTEKTRHAAEPRLLSGLGARFALSPTFFTALHVGLLGGTTERRHPDQSHVAFGYDGVHAALLAGFTRGWVHAAAGPVLLELQGDWRTLSRDGAAPAEWSAWSLGTALDAGVLVPLSPRTGIDFSGRYRRLPEAEVAGYRSSEPTAIDFSQWAAAIAFAVRF